LRLFCKADLLFIDERQDDELLGDPVPVTDSHERHRLSRPFKDFAKMDVCKMFNDDCQELYSNCPQALDLAEQFTKFLIECKKPQHNKSKEPFGGLVLRCHPYYQNGERQDFYNTVKTENFPNVIRICPVDGPYNDKTQNSFRNYIHEAVHAIEHHQTRVFEDILDLLSYSSGERELIDATTRIIHPNFAMKYRYGPFFLQHIITELKENGLKKEFGAFNMQYNKYCEPIKSTDFWNEVKALEPEYPNPFPGMREVPRDEILMLIESKEELSILQPSYGWPDFPKAIFGKLQEIRRKSKQNSTLIGFYASEFIAFIIESLLYPKWERTLANNIATVPFIDYVVEVDRVYFFLKEIIQQIQRKFDSGMLYNYFLIASLDNYLEILRSHLIPMSEGAMKREENKEN